MNITLPGPTLRLLDRVAGRGNRSRVIDEAVRFYVESKGRQNLRRLLQEGAAQRAERDRGVAEEWFRLDENS